LIALTKKDGGIRPISYGYTSRRLAAKCANDYVIKKRSEALQPQQLCVGLPGGAEAAVPEVRRVVTNLPHHHVVIKLDFLNAFDSVRRDFILDNITAHTPEIYRLVHAAYSCEFWRLVNIRPCPRKGPSKEIHWGLWNSARQHIPSSLAWNRMSS